MLKSNRIIDRIVDSPPPNDMGICGANIFGFSGEAQVKAPIPPFLWWLLLQAEKCGKQ